MRNAHDDDEHLPYCVYEWVCVQCCNRTASQTCTVRVYILRHARDDAYDYALDDDAHLSSLCA
jgi:hypothetical protein